jgi:hypothetical protein
MNAIFGQYSAQFSNSETYEKLESLLYAILRKKTGLILRKIE